MLLPFCLTYPGVSEASLEEEEAIPENGMEEDAVFFLSVPRRAQESGL